MTGDADLASSVLLQDLTKEYISPSGEPFRAVDGISLHARPGTIFGLLGPNGAGKTTTLRMLSTLIPPTSGRAVVGGCDVVREPAEVRKRIGFLTGSTGLYPRLTAREVVRYFASMYGMSREAIDRRILELFDRLEITAYQDKRCGELSTGMRQKVSIARAIIHDPPILILDEPTTGLDVLASRHIVDFILSSRDRGRCVIFSTHIMSEAERLCDEIAIIHRGRITAHGTIGDLKQATGQDKIEDVFLAYLRDDAPPVESRSMNLREIRIVLGKEILDTLRDRRTIMAMIVLPLLIYPLLIVVISQLGIQQVQKLQAAKARIAFTPEDAAPDLLDAFRADTNFVVVVSPDPEAALAERDIDAILVLPEDFDRRMQGEGGDPFDITLRVDLSRDRGERMRDKVREFIFDWRTDLVGARLEERNLPANFVKPFLVQVDNAADTRKMSGSFLGRILPFFLVVMMMTGAFYPAIDVTAGERERGTLETLLVVPANRFYIVLGKFFTVFLASMITTLANMASIAFTAFFLIGSLDINLPAGENIASLLDWRALLLIFVIMIPMALLFSSLAMLVATFARSFKEAQNYLSPLVMACMAPAYLSFLPGIEISGTWSLVPIANVVLLSREFLLGNYTWNYFVITLVTVSGIAIFLLARTVSLFGGEAMLGGGSTPLRVSITNLFRRQHPGTAVPHSPGVVAQVFPLVLLGFFYLAAPLQMRDIGTGMLVTQIVVVAGIPWVAMRLFRIPPLTTLRLTPGPRPMALLWVAIGAPAVTLLAIAAASLSESFLPVPESYRKMMETLIGAEGDRGLVMSLLLFAVLPGICEEILFRGFVLRGLLARLRPGPAILWTGLLFGAFHFDMYRLIPTTVLGMVLGWVAWRTGSLWPAILLHAANNAIAVLATNLPALQDIPWLAEGGEIPLPVLVTVSVVGLLALFGLLRTPRVVPREAQEPPLADRGAA